MHGDYQQMEFFMTECHEKTLCRLSGWTNQKNFHSNGDIRIYFWSGYSSLVLPITNYMQAMLMLHHLTCECYSCFENFVTGKRKMKYRRIRMASRTECKVQKRFWTVNCICLPFFYSLEFELR
jgi:hypothetical protein